MAVVTTNLGVVTAYGDAVAAGYTGTKAEFQALLAQVPQSVTDAANAVEQATEANEGYTELKNTFTDLLNVPTNNAVDGYMVNSADGSVSANTNFSYIEFAVLGGDTIAYNTQRAETAVGIAFYDKYGLYAAGYPAVAGEQILVVPDNAATAKAAYRTAHAGAFYVKFLGTLMRLVDNASKETSIPQNIGDITTESYDVAARITQGVRLTGYNTTTFLPITRTDSAYFMAEMVLPQNMEEVIIPTPTSTPDYNFLIAYTENTKALNTKYAQLVNGTSAMRDYVSIETDGVHIKVKKLISAGYANLAIEGLATDFGSFAINGSGVSLDWASVPLPETGQAKQYTGLSMFETIHCLGDSYTQGGIKSSDGANWLRAKKPYPQVIADNLGIDVTNFGVGGASVKSYLTNGLSAVLNANPPDLYILCFGINDAGNADTVGTIADINGSDYTLNADSFCGNYGRILAQLKAHAPLARYVIIGQWHWDTSTIVYGQYTAAAKAVAEHYSIPFVDPFDDTFFATSLYRSTMVSGHPTQVTYTGMAYAVMRLMAECIADNDAYYRYAGLEVI